MHSRSSAPVGLIPAVSQVLAVLGNIDSWQFDAFKLDEVSYGCPLSMVAFAIMKKCDLVPGRLVANAWIHTLGFS